MESFVGYLGEAAKHTITRLLGQNAGRQKRLEGLSPSVYTECLGLRPGRIRVTEKHLKEKASV